jgi:hypothetical protein
MKEESLKEVIPKRIGFGNAEFFCSPFGRVS